MPMSWVIIFFGCYILAVGMLKQDAYWMWIADLIMGIGFFTAFIVFTFQGDIVNSIVSFIFAVWNFWDWWRKRNNRKKNKSETHGEKTKAIIKKMVSKLDPSPIPPPVKDS